jgi:hypothetical protein
MTDHKHNEDNREEPGVTDVSSLIQNLKQLCATFGRNA